VLRVTPSTAADRSGVQGGDVITLAGEITAPAPDQVRAAYAAGREGGGVLMALTRGAIHRVVVLER
jgi:S1-C subfamily serine protease